MGILRKIKLSWLIIIVLSIVLFIQLECHHCPVSEPCPPATHTTEYIKGDSIPVPYPQIIPGKDSIIHVPVPANIDTAAILAKYFAKHYGHDTLADDTSTFVAIDWMVTQNKLQWVKPYIANRRATVINNTTTYVNEYKPRLKVFVGLGISIYDTIPGLKQNNLAPSLHASFAFLTKKDHLYSTTIDPFREFYTATVYLKLKSPWKK